MGELLPDDVVHTDYGQFDVVWGDGFGFDGDFDRFFDGQVHGLVGAADPNGLYVNLARMSGGSGIVIELLQSEPTLLDEEWADVVEVSVSVPGTGRPRWSSWAGQSGGPLDIPEGHYRVRVVPAVGTLVMTESSVTRCWITTGLSSRAVLAHGARRPSMSDLARLG